MFRTIILGTCVSVQGKVVDILKDGRLTVQVGKKFFTGRSVTPWPKPKNDSALKAQLVRA